MSDETGKDSIAKLFQDEDEEAEGKEDPTVVGIKSVFESINEHINYSARTRISMLRRNRTMIDVNEI